ncbi:transposase, mutator type [Artemisia annua]|uniref:Transposase, mutator type n=1 Tax=Artemisia annua TaxID=35608 RepID=A0A2U1NBU3_ARTAN|nr:transposase, mutator type [Artemisia annua]
MQKVLRAKRIAVRGIRSEFNLQFTMLRDYVQELQKKNPNTTVVIHVERPAENSLPTREFKRLYVCLGSLKEGFKACQRQLLGINSYPIEGPLKGHFLVAVGIDSNNGIYPFAYAFAESENTIAWTWFLHCLSDDLELEPHLIFTFVTDMKKDITSALREVFPNAEHIYCLRSIHEQMKVNWPGRAFKYHLWRCATASTVVQFEKCMDALKTFSQAAHAWLNQIPPIHWSRPHFSWRPHSDVLLNNMCQVFHEKIIKDVNKPIIIALEYIREYCMKRIMHVVTVIEKSDGPLTPTTQHMLEGIKKEAIRYNVLWNGGDKFQVTGPWGDQCVVNIVEKSCTCRRWEITGLPCKHVVTTNWNMALNRQQVGAIETWAHPCYCLNTWEATYKHNVSPITSNEHWEKSFVPTTIVPPKSQANAANSTSKKRVRLAPETEELVKNGKLSKAWKSVSNEHWEKSFVPTTIVPPKSQANAANSTSKKRVRLAPETEELVKNGKLSKAWKSVRCSVCGIAGHNRKTCLGYGGTQSSQTAPKRQKCSTAKGKGKKVPQKVASNKTHPTGNKVAADNQAEGTGADESQDVAVEDQGTQDVATEKQDEFAGVQSRSQDQPIDESQCQSQQQDLSQSQSLVHSSNVQAVSVSSQYTTRRVTRQQAFMDRMMPSA